MTLLIGFLTLPEIDAIQAVKKNAKEKECLFKLLHMYLNTAFKIEQVNWY